MAASPSAEWGAAVAADRYGIADWGAGYFGIGADGNLKVRPEPGAEHEIDLPGVVAALEDRGLEGPLLLRFPQILADRLRRIHDAFTRAMFENGFRGGHLAVFPVQVDQRRPVLEDVHRLGRRYGCGLQVGSTPELLAVLATTAGSRRPILCTGFKDRDYARAALLATKLGRDVIPVADRIPEVRMLIELARRHGVRLRMGVRVRPGESAMTAGGPSPATGMSVPELLELRRLLLANDMLDALKLVRCRADCRGRGLSGVRETVAELAHVHAELVRMGADLEYVDVGGAPGVDVGGGRTTGPEAAAEAGLGEFASEVVYRIASVCDEAGIEHPTIVAEPGRSIAAHHGVLVFEALGTRRRTGCEPRTDLPPSEDVEQPVWDLYEALTLAERERLAESYHDAVDAHARAMDLFRLGYLPLEQRALAERLFRAVTSRIHASGDGELPPELDGADDLVRDTYLCNLSIFRSLPDIWARRRAFPIVPIQRLDERPTRKGVLADVTCDSDGRIDRFPVGRRARRTLDLHPLRDGERYRLAAFLVGAYQGAMGDPHNLFGETPVASVRSIPGGGWRIDGVATGATAAGVLARVRYDAGDLHARIAGECAAAVRDGRLDAAEGKALTAVYADGLESTTYLRHAADPDDHRSRT